MALPPQITDNTVYTIGGVSGMLKTTFGAQGIYYGYCTIADVLYELPQNDSFTTLTASVLAQEISYAAIEFQQELAQYYVMPYAGTDGGILLQLRNINAKLATANIIDRYLSAAGVATLQDAVEKRHWAETMVLAVKEGQIQWSIPYGDAVPLAEKPTTPRAAGATIMPNPNSSDPFAATPLFTMGLNRFRRGGLM